MLDIPKINKSLKTTRKAIIGVGCSFVEGQGAFDTEIYENYPWTCEEVGVPLKLCLDQDQESQFLSSYPEVKKNSDGSYDYSIMEDRNSFVNVLATKYMDNEYTPINMGIRGRGNRASSKSLYFHTEIDWDSIDEGIMLYCPSDISRLDFSSDNWFKMFRGPSYHNYFRCIWPHERSEDTPMAKLWNSYAEALYSDRMACMEQIIHVRDLVNWCKVNNFKLIVTSAFDMSYTPEFFFNAISKEVARNLGGEIVKISDFPDRKKIQDVVNQFPWENYFKPDNFLTFADFAASQDSEEEHGRYFNYFRFLGKGSPDMWITPCSHPDAKAHDLFAQKLFEHIQGTS